MAERLDASSSQPIDTSTRDHKDRNNESQHRLRLHKKGLRIGEQFPLVNSVVVSFSSEQLACRASITGPELGDLCIAGSIRRGLYRLVRGLRTRRTELEPRLDFTVDGIYAVMRLLKKNGYVAPANEQGMLDVLESGCSSTGLKPAQSNQISLFIQSLKHTNACICRVCSG